MKKITRLDDDKSKLYDKFIKYLKDKGYSTPIPTTVDDDLKALGFDKDEELVEILDAMLERKIVEKRIGDTEPKFTITESELDTLAAEPENLQNFAVNSDRLINVDKIEEEYEKEYKAYKEAVRKKQTDMLTKFEMQDLSDLPDVPTSDYLDEDEITALQTKVDEEVDKSLNPALVAVFKESHGDFDWKQMVERVIDFKKTMSEKSELIKQLEKDCKDGKLNEVKITNITKFRSLNRLNSTIQSHLMGIEAFQDIASKYGIRILTEGDKFTITSSAIPELKFEQQLLSKELQARVSGRKEETTKFGEMDIPEPLSQEEFKKVIQRQKILLKDTEPDQSTCYEEMQEIISKEEASTDKENTTSMVLSMNDDGELKYYKVTVLNADLDRFKSLVSMCKAIGETDDMVPTPVEYNKDTMTVPEYEDYLTRFYKAYGLDKDYTTDKNPLLEKRAPYPHERTGAGHTYYETVYSPYVTTYKKSARVENNDYLIGLLTSAKASAEMTDEQKTKIDELIALLTIDDIPGKRATGDIVDGIGFICEKDKLEAIKTKLKEVDPLGTLIPAMAIPVPREKGETESIEDYEKFLVEHYKKYYSEAAPSKDPLTEEIRKPYPHERASIDKDGKIVLGAPAADSYYSKFYVPYAESKGLKAPKTLTGKFGGKRAKVTGKEDGLEHKGVLEAIKKFFKKLDMWDKSFDGEKNKNIKELLKRGILIILAIAAVVIILQLFAPGLLPWNFFPTIAKWIGSAGNFHINQHVIGKLVMALFAALGLGAMIAYAKWKKVFKKTKYPEPGKKGEEPEPETPDLPTEDDVEKLLADGADLESIISKLVADYAKAKREYDIAEELATDPEHATEEIKADRDVKFDTKEKTKEDLVDGILIGLSYVEPEEMTEEIGGMTL